MPSLCSSTAGTSGPAARLPYWQNVVNASGDTYDNEASRDIEPTKGDMGDNYYALLVDAVRKWKGAEPVPAAGEDKTIDLNDVSSWDSVTPVYYNNKGTYNRNSRILRNQIREQHGKKQCYKSKGIEGRRKPLFPG